MHQTVGDVVLAVRDAGVRAQAALFFPMYSPQQRMEAYAILGGMPLYLEQFDPEQDIEQNVISTVLQRHTFLSEEPEWLLLEEFRRDLLYSSILRTGFTPRLQQLAQAEGERLLLVDLKQMYEVNISNTSSSSDEEWLPGQDSNLRPSG